MQGWIILVLEPGRSTGGVAVVVGHCHQGGVSVEGSAVVGHGHRGGAAIVYWTFGVRGVWPPTVLVIEVEVEPWVLELEAEVESG